MNCAIPTPYTKRKALEDTIVLWVKMAEILKSPPKGSKVFNLKPFVVKSLGPEYAYLDDFAAHCPLCYYDFKASPADSCAACPVWGSDKELADSEAVCSSTGQPYGLWVTAVNESNWPGARSHALEIVELATSALESLGPTTE